MKEIVVASTLEQRSGWVTFAGGIALVAVLTLDALVLYGLLAHGDEFA